MASRSSRFSARPKYATAKRSTPARKKASGRRTARNASPPRGEARRSIGADADAPAGQALRRGRHPPGDRNEEEEAEHRELIEAGRGGLQVLSDAGAASRAEPEREREEPRRARRRRERDDGPSGPGEREPRRHQGESQGHEDDEPREQRHVPGVRQRLARRHEPHERRSAEALSSGRGRIAVGANEVERRAGEQQEDGNRENVRVEVREDEAPERILVDGVADDARGGPEVVPVESVLLDEPLAQPRKVSEKERQPGAGEARAQAPAPVARHRVSALQDGAAEEAESQVERKAGREVRQEREDDHHLLSERVVAERRAGQPRVRGREQGCSHEDVQDREVHRLLAPVDLGIQRPDSEKEQEPEGKHGLALEERPAVLADEPHDVVAVAEKRPGRRDGEKRQGSQDGAAAVGKDAPRHAERREVRGDDEAEHAGESEAPVGKTREGGEGDRRGEKAHPGERQVPEDRRAKRAAALRLLETRRLDLGLPVGPHRGGHAPQSRGATSPTRSWSAGFPGSRP